MKLRYVFLMMIYDLNEFYAGKTKLRKWVDEDEEDDDDDGGCFGCCCCVDDDSCSSN